MPNCPRNCGDCKHCVAAHAQLVIDEKDAENAKLRAEKSQALLDCAELAMLRDKLNLQNGEYRDALEYAFGICCNLKAPGHSWVDDLIDYLGKRLSDSEKPVTLKPKREGLCTNSRDGEDCLKPASHEGICEGPQHVWDWKPTYGKKKV